LVFWVRRTRRKLVIYDYDGLSWYVRARVRLVSNAGCCMFVALFYAPPVSLTLELLVAMSGYAPLFTNAMFPIYLA
jgi:hypothetical protein